VIHTQAILDEIEADLSLFLTTGQVAGLLHCTRRHVYRVIRLRQWRTVQDRSGSPLLIPRQVVMGYLAERLGG
jgi:excisionase family DNA binding protein